jgi:conjugative transfer pilus assembly protein TraH
MVSKNSADAFTTSEQQFIQASTPGVYGLLRGLASEMQSANLVADRMVDIVATELTAQVVDDMYDTVNSAVRASGKPMDSQMAEVMHDRRAEINEARRVNADSVNSVNTLIQLQKTIRESLRSPMNNKVH